jgi:hypothetical protein
MSRETFAGGFDEFVSRASRSADKDLAMDYTVRDLAAERKEAKLKAAIERERGAAAERRAEREMERQMNEEAAFYVERELRNRGERNMTREALMEIMPEIRKAASRVHYGSHTENLADLAQEKLAPKRSRGMHR